METEAPIPFGKYTLIRRIGAGGMGEVFLAREGMPGLPGGARVCVVKKVLPELAQNRVFLGRFLDEAKVSVRLKHDNIARVYAMGDVAGEYFLAMEYVQGKTISRFSRKLREHGKMMPLGEALLLGERICDGLTYAHEATDERGDLLHLVHRDLSPSNVCVSYRGEVKIIDFGASQSTLKEEHTAPKVVIGNLAYMAPEQARKQRVDRRADLYSTGAVLWELLSGRLLPQKGDPIERWRRAANPSWELPSKYRSELPPEVDALILKALAKKADDRFQDAGEMGRALSDLRQKIAPDASDATLSALLTRAFAGEKAAEDVLLDEVVRGKPILETPTDKTQLLVPPTALAFEHRAVAGQGYPEDGEAVTDPGEHGARDVTEGRVTFGDPGTEEVGEDLIREIEGSGSKSEPEFIPSRPYASDYVTVAPRGSRVRWPLYAAAFAVALSLGFASVLYFGTR